MGKLSAPPPLIFLPPPSPPTNLQPTSTNLDSKIRPSFLLVIIILAIIFFVSSLLHLLVRWLLGATQRDPDDVDNVTALQGQLRQLFHLHDSGVDQSYIDTLPVFHYKAIIGVKDPFDCAVCLCEFEPDDKLRLLPKCSHAFHMDCIDTWLLSHSTCPLCRFSLLADYSGSGRLYRNPIPIVCVLESGSGENSREIPESVLESDTRVGINREVEFGSNRTEVGRKSSEIWVKEEGGNGAEDEKILMVKLGKFKSVDGGEGSSEENANGNGNGTEKGNGNLGSRRCYSMGSFAYVLDEGTSLQVPVKTLMKKQSNKKTGNRAAISEYGGCDSRREFNGIEAFRSIEFHSHGKGNAKRESFSVSKIWQRGGIGGTGERERERKGNECGSKRTISEIEIEEGEIERGDEETQSNYSVESVANSTSHRRTLLWLMGRHNKVVHNHSSSMSSTV